MTPLAIPPNPYRRRKIGEEKQIFVLRDQQNKNIFYDLKKICIEKNFFYAKKVGNVVMVFGHVSFCRIKKNYLFYYYFFLFSKIM